LLSPQVTDALRSKLQKASPPRGGPGSAAGSVKSDSGQRRAGGARAAGRGGRAPRGRADSFESMP